MHILIVGANSDLAHAIARIFAKNEKANLYIASRDLELLQKKAKDISERYNVNVQASYIDATDYNSHKAFYEKLDPKPNGVIVTFGIMGNQKDAQNDFESAKKTVETNYLGAVSLLELVAADFENRKSGFIIGVSSVAGARGRQGNYIYGSSKAAFTHYLSGLRNRLFNKNIHVMTVIPGYMKTKMISHISVPRALTAEPARAAHIIYDAYRSRKDVVYIDYYWKWIMSAINIIPERIFKRLNF